MAHRKFSQTSQHRQQEAPEPVSFDIAHENDILCRQYANGKLLMELLGKVESGNVSVQTEGILSIFDVVVRTDDGDEPEAWSGKKYDRMRPFENHTQAELDSIDEQNDEIREENVEIRERNEAKVAEANSSGEDVDDDDLEEYVPLIAPGIDPTSSWGRLNSVLNDPNVPIELVELSEIVGWLVEQYTGRPTRRSGSSRGGSGSTNRGSRRARRSPAKTGATVNSDGSST